MKKPKEQLSKEKKLFRFLTIVGACFAAGELIVALITNSQAILMDAAYDTTELMMTILAFRFLPLVYKPTTEKRPFGYLQVETMLVVIKGFMMLIVTLGIIINNIQLMLSGGHVVRYDMLVAFEFICAAISLGVLWRLKRENKTLNSPLLTTEMNEWKIDVTVSVGFGLAFLIPLIVQTQWMARLSPYLDQWMAIGLAFYMLPIPIQTLRTALKDLFLFAPELEIMTFIKEETEALMQPLGFESLDYDVVRTGRKVWVSVYFDSPKNEVLISEISEWQTILKAKLRAQLDDVYVEILPNIPMVK